MSFTVSLLASFAWPVLVWFVFFPKSFGKHIGVIIASARLALKNQESDRG